MRKSLRCLALCLIAGMASIAAFAQTITLKGTVRNSSNQQSVPAVSVTVKGTSDGTFTDENGNFSITTAAKLPITLVISSINFESKEVSVTDPAGAVTVELAPTSTLGQEVVVAATRTAQRALDAPVTIERLGGASLRAIAAPNYYEALTNLKGVDMHTASLTFRTITTRGFVSSGNSRMNQLIDGMDNMAPGLNFSVGNIVGLTELDVDNIELLSGASSALYGSGGMNGTLLINSKNPFKYQGLSFNIKQGIMHTDGKQRSPSPYYDWSMRFAKNFKDKIAIKISGQLLRANDWEANDMDNVARNNVLSKIIPGNRQTDPNYDGVNVYGDETSANMLGVTQSIQNSYIAGINLASGGAIPNIAALLNGIIPSNATQSQINAILAGAFGSNPTLLSTVSQFFPFYWGLRNNLVPNQNVSRTGYNERDLVDYNSLNFKFNAGVHYKITPNIEASWNTYWGTGTTVYTGADRYSLKNFKMAQHKLEVKSKNWFVRGYTTQENAGQAYNATVLGRLMQEAFRPSEVWYPTYIGNYLGYKLAVLGNGLPPDEYGAHQFARNAADVNRPLPGTPSFNALKDQISSTAIPAGAKFLDKSDMWSAEGQLNLSDALGFSDKVEMIAGANWKLYVLNSQGTIFSDTTGPLKINETGGYIQLRKKLFNDVLTLTAAGRYDKNKNFEGRFTPRFTGVIKVAKDNNLRVSYQTAYRFPTNQNQYINLNVGSGILIGGIPEFQTYYGLNTNPGYTAESIAAARAANNPALLVQAVYKGMKPESVVSTEFGYKGLIGKKLLLDAYYYFSKYTDFLAAVAVGQSLTGSPAGILNPLTTRNLSYTENSASAVKANGWGFGLDYQMARGYIFSGNVYSDVLNNVPSGFVTFFNAPKYRVNLGLRNENIIKNLGFNFIMKWQDEVSYEGTFVTGTLPAILTADVQFTYKVPNSKGVIRIGGTNVANTYRRTGYGSPAVGGLYYVSYGYNIF
ncbi:MAG: TonB-dependent receptor plug domain-containing protein [Terrimonas sp.]|nr:TonB-dependent receptor plug domain-containing protein [Terrimonas sp.]